MAIKKNVIVGVDTGDAVKNVDNLKDSFVELGDEAVESGDEAQDSMDGINESSKGAEGGVKGVSSAFKGLGTALKAAGIGLIIAAFAAFAKVLGENQAVMDTLNVIMETTFGIVRQIVTAFTDAWTSVKQATDGFDAMKKVVLGLINIALAPLKIQFFTIKAAIQSLQLGWEKSFLGKGRPEKIDELQKALKETRDDIKNVVKGVADAGKDIVKNFGEAISEVNEFGSAIVTNLNKVSLAAATTSAKSLVALRNWAKLEQAIGAQESARLEEQISNQKRIRDNVNETVEARIKANEKLGTLIRDQRLAEESGAKEAIRLAKAELVGNEDNVEKKIALIEAETQLAAIRATAAGKFEEQSVQRIALERELRNIQKTGTKQELDSYVAVATANAEVLKNEKDRLERTKLNIDNQFILEKDRLEKLIALEKEGTQLRADLDAELNTLIIQNKIDTFENENDLIDLQRERDLEVAEFDKENLFLSFEERRAAELTRREILLDDLTLSLDQRRLLEDEFAQDEIDTARTVAEAKAAIQSAAIDNVANGFKLLGKLAGKNKALQVAAIIGENAAGVAKQIIATREANAKVTAKYALLPGGAVLAAAEKTVNNVSLGLGIASSVAATATAIKALGGGGSPTVPSGAGGGTSTGTRVSQIDPSFNTVGEGSTNQLANVIAAQQQQPIKAFVVSTEVTTAQSLDRSISEGAVFGS